MQGKSLCEYYGIPAKAQLVFKRGYLGFPVAPPIEFKQTASRHSAAPLQDRGEFHITIIGPKEVKKLSTEAKKQVKQGFELSTQNMQYVSVSCVRDLANDNATYFVVIDWPEAQQFRKTLGLPEKDFHITLGFIKEDIHRLPNANGECLEVKKDRSAEVVATLRDLGL